MGSQPLPTTNSEDVDGGARPRSGTWGSGKTVDAKKDGGAGKSSKSGSRSGSTSRSSSMERRKSGEDTTQSPSRKPGMLDAFRPRSKSDASKKKSGTLMAHMKSAMQVSILDITRITLLISLSNKYFFIKSSVYYMISSTYHVYYYNYEYLNEIIIFFSILV